MAIPDRSMDGQLAGRVAIVTGADSGIGRAIAEEFAREGAHVMVTYHTDREGAAQTLRQLESAGRRGALMQADVRVAHEVARIFERTERELGTPLILVNNAGIGGGTGVADEGIDEWDRILKTNLYGPFYCAREFIRRRREVGGRGKMINITSVHEDIVSPGFAAYNASKAGLRNLTRTLALELAPLHINVNNIAPGMILTPMNEEAVEKEEVRVERAMHIPWKRPGEPWEVAKLALYLASDDSDYVTGQSFVIDGGLTLNVGQGA